jgi:Tfp pilus assembly protein PilN
MQELNFLKSQQQQLKKKAQRQFFLQISAFSLLVVYGLIILATFTYNFLLKKESQSLADRISQQKQKIESAAEVETKQVYLKSKIINLQQILATAQDNQKLIEGFFSLLPEGVAVKGFDISQKGMLEFTGSAESFTVLDNLFKNVEKKQLGQKQIFGASVGKVTLEKGAGFNFSLTLLLQPAKITSK